MATDILYKQTFLLFWKQLYKTIFNYFPIVIPQHTNTALHYNMLACSIFIITIWVAVLVTFLLLRHHDQGNLREDRVYLGLTAAEG